MSLLRPGVIKQYKLLATKLFYVSGSSDPQQTQLIKPSDENPSTMSDSPKSQAGDLTQTAQRSGNLSAMNDSSQSQAGDLTQTASPSGNPSAMSDSSQAGDLTQTATPSLNLAAPASGIQQNSIQQNGVQQNGMPQNASSKVQILAQPGASTETPNLPEITSQSTEENVSPTKQPDSSTEKHEPDSLLVEHSHNVSSLTRSKCAIVLVKDFLSSGKLNNTFSGFITQELKTKDSANVPNNGDK